jgi:hypothetical protein
MGKVLLHLWEIDALEAPVTDLVIDAKVIGISSLARTSNLPSSNFIVWPLFSQEKNEISLWSNRNIYQMPMSKKIRQS